LHTRAIAQIAEDYQLPVEKVLDLCDQLGIAYKTAQTRLPLEDAKAIMSQIIAEAESGSDSSADSSPD
jgi:hypothetical protein